MVDDAITVWEDFFDSRMRDVIRDVFAQYPKKKSVNVDFELFDAHQPELAEELIKNPDVVVQTAEKAVQSFNPQPEKKADLHVRIYNVPTLFEASVQQLGAEHLDHLVRTEGVVSWVTDIKPLMKTALWQCIHCLSTIKTATEKASLKPPLLCKCGRRDFKLIEKSSDFVNLQRAQIQELVEKLRGNAPTANVELWMEDDLVNVMAPGEKFIVTGVLRLKQIKDGKTRGSVYAKFLDVLHLQRLEREFEEIEISKEEQHQIEHLAKDPRLFERLVDSVAPSIYGYRELKEAVALQLFGGTPGKVLPDGKRIRSDMHVLLIGDPGCLIGDERGVLGNGAVVKIGQLGEKHLQPIKQLLLTGQGHRKAVATMFHKYERQPVLEIVTESGKSIKGTYNHPLLMVKRMRRYWKRLDKIKVGDRVATVPWITCSIQKCVELDWRRIPRTLGPKPSGVLPTKLTPELAAFMGYVLGDGWVTRTRVAMDVSLEEKDLIEPLQNFSRKTFGMPLKHRTECRESKKPIHVLELHNVDIAFNLQMLREKRMPDLIMRSGNAAVSEFLAWLFEADGTVFSKDQGRRGVQLKSASIELLRDVQVMLLRFGIHSRIVERNLTIRRARSIRKFARHIGFRSAKKKAKLAKLVEDVKNLHHKLGKQLSERVVLVRPAGIEDVYDVEVPSAKRFIANGIVSHNTAKSSILSYVSNIAPKSVYVSGESATAVGLTASAERDADGEGWILKAGAMVLANGGLAIIDEFDKMGIEDRGSIHQAMEQQLISVAKAGIVTQFQARTSVLAAANPKLGRFDPNVPPAQQFNISPALLSRFDLIFTIKDVLDETRDRKMADHILLGHKLALQKTTTGEEAQVMPSIDIELLRKYIAYARRNIHPILTTEASEKIKEFYVELRRLGEKDKTFPVTARQIEGVIRLAEASAKMRLSPRVELQDADRAIALVNFVLHDVFVDHTTGRIDSDIISIGQPKSRVDRMRTVLSIIHSLEKQFDLVAVEDVVKEASTYGLDEIYARRLIDELKRQGDLYEPKLGHIRSSRREL